MLRFWDGYRLERLVSVPTLSCRAILAENYASSKSSLSRVAPSRVIRDVDNRPVPVLDTRAACKRVFSSHDLMGRSSGFHVISLLRIVHPESGISVPGHGPGWIANIDLSFFGVPMDYRSHADH